MQPIQEATPKEPAQDQPNAPVEIENKEEKLLDVPAPTIGEIPDKKNESESKEGESKEKIKVAKEQLVYDYTDNPEKTFK